MSVVSFAIYLLVSRLANYWLLLIWISPYRSLQEAQPPLRNRASATHFFVAKLFSIAVMTYSYFYHLRSLRPANLLRTQRINFSMRPQHVRMTRDPLSFDISFLENPCEYPHNLYIARN